jgi:hypothetical protein
MHDRLSLGGGRHHFFSQQILQRRVIQHGIGQKLLQASILILKPL